MLCYIHQFDTTSIVFIYVYFGLNLTTYNLIPFLTSYLLPLSYVSSSLIGLHFVLSSSREYSQLGCTLTTTTSAPCRSLSGPLSVHRTPSDVAYAAADISPTRGGASADDPLSPLITARFALR